MRVNIHKSGQRGFRDQNWLQSWHSFSFADYFNPLREKFGVIRVLNDERLAPGSGFQMHEYKNLEIILIPLKGSFKFEWINRSNVSKPEISAGDMTSKEEDLNFITENRFVSCGEFLLISTGSGLSYSITNNDVDSLELIQIWIFPEKKNSRPNVQLGEFKNKRKNIVQKLLSSEKDANVMHINQKVQLSICKLESNNLFDYTLTDTSNYLFVFIIEGQVQLLDSGNANSNDYIAEYRDSIEVSMIEYPIQFKALQSSKLLIIETQPD